MGRKRTAGLYERNGVWHIDKQIRGIRICESTGECSLAKAEEYLASIAERLKREGVTKVETSVWYGKPASAIVEAAQFGKVDLIIMCTHGRSGMGRLILGSVAESVLRGTHTPILLLRPEGAPLERPAGPARAHA